MRCDNLERLEMLMLSGDMANNLKIESIVTYRKMP